MGEVGVHLGRRIALPRWLAIKTGGLAERLLVTILVAAGIIQLTNGWNQLHTILNG